MVRAVDLIGSNSQFQNHWIRRFVAAFIDWIIMAILWIIISIMITFAQIFLPGGFYILPFFSGILWVLYSGIMEGIGGSTIGKSIMNLSVVSLEGQMDLVKGFLRNLTKIYGLLLLIDWLVGFITDGDPRQRFMDRFSGTTVVRTDIQEIFTGAFQPPMGPMPAPVGTPPPQPLGPQYTQPATPYEPPKQAASTNLQVELRSSTTPAYRTPTQSPTTPLEQRAPVAPSEGGAKTYTRSELVNMKKEELMAIARQKGMKTSGTKRDLVDRILGEEGQS